MAKKDIFDRLSRPSPETRTRRAEAPAVTDEAGTEVTKVGSGVVRRRRVAEPAGPAAGNPAVIRRRRPADEPEAPPPAPERPAERVAAPEPKPSPVVEATPAEPAIEAPTPSHEPEPVVAAEPERREEVAAAPPPEPAPAPAPPPSPEPVAVAPEAPPAAPSAEELPAQPRYRGLGLGVVVPPPGYDPTNPEAFRERQRREAAAAGRTAADPRAARARRRPAGAETPVVPAVPVPVPEDDEDGRGRRARGRRRSAFDRGGAAGPGGLGVRPRRRKKGAPKSASPQPKAQKRKVRVDGAISVGQLARELSVKAAVLIKKLIELGTPARITDMLDIETASIVAQEFDYEIENVGFDESEYLEHIGEEEDEEEQEQRPPVVTIMGHVDHGKTTLLDTIRKSRVAAGEAGGITQHIGAYQVEHDGQIITFLDTPGHAAFSAMRARGASVTDIVILVVAADDGVQPQTVEAINHARAAGVPIIVAVNKCDKPGVNPDAVKQRLGEFHLVPEEWGGENLFVNVSALKKQGIDELLEAVVLQADMLELAANPERACEGTVIEAKMERGRGPVATVLVQNGTLNQGDHVVIGTTFGKVRALMDYRGESIKTAGPSTPVELFGLSALPNTGDTLSVVKNEKNARTLAEHRAEQERLEKQVRQRRKIEDLFKLAAEGEIKTLFLVIKADVQGSVEAVRTAVENLHVDGCEVRVLHAGVGNITESDVSLVAANDGLLVGFNVRIDPRARRAADEAGVEPELFSVIYAVLDRVEGMLKGMLEPVYEEQHQGTAEVRAVFNISKVGSIAGCYIQEGKIARSNGARLYRDGAEIWKGGISSLKRFKDDVREVAAGYECGISLDGFNDIREGDIIESFAMVEVAVE